MKSDLFDYCLSGFLESEPDTDGIALKKKEFGPELHQLGQYFDEEGTLLMKRLSVFARLRTAELDRNEDKSGLGPDPGNQNIDNSLLSDVLIKTSWLGKKQLEPQDVMDYMERKKMTGEIVTRFKKNINSVVLIGRKEMFDIGGKLITRRLSSSKVSTSVLLSNGEESEEEMNCGFDIHFPFRDQETVQREIADNSKKQQAFFGTGFFVTDKVVATAGHVVQAMIDDLKENPNASFVVVQNHRLGIDPKIHLTSYVVDPNRLTHLHGIDGQLQDWAYLEVKTVSTNFVSLVDSADCGKEVYCLGHGLGLPLKMGWNGLLFKIDDDIFRCKLETFSGNSGSPVFCAQTHAVIGILSGTDKEFYHLKGENEKGCWVLPKVYLHGFNGAVFTKIGPLMTRLKEDNLLD